MKFMNKTQKRKGSTLALTIIIFAVLMIFATFTLGFMVTENKQAMYYQNKTQAYYIARSGAEVVEAALKEQLLSYGNDLDQHKQFIDVYDNPQEINLSLDNLDGPVVVVNEVINGRRVMTINASSTYNGVKESVKKVLYAHYTLKNDSGFLPGGSLFVYLGDAKPQEYGKSGSTQRDIPPEYVTKVSEEEKVNYTKESFDLVNWDDVPDGDVTISGGYSLPEGTSTVYVDGSLTLGTGDINLSGNVTIYVRENVVVLADTRIIGDIVDGENKLEIYVYNDNHTEVSPVISFVNYDYSVDHNSNYFVLKGNLFVEKGDINIGFSQSSYIEGHIVYNGTGNVRLKTNSNSYNQDRLITGSVYAPFGTIDVGIQSYKTAQQIGGQLIGDSINVYVNNSTQGYKFYDNSTAGRLDNPIPIETEGVDLSTINYISIYQE